MAKLPNSELPREPGEPRGGYQPPHESGPIPGAEPTPGLGEADGPYEPAGQNENDPNPRPWYEREPSHPPAGTMPDFPASPPQTSNSPAPNPNGEKNEKSAAEVPESVTNSWILFSLAALVSLISPVTKFFPGGSTQTVQAMRDMLPASMGQYSDEQLQSAMAISNVVIVVFWVLFAAAIVVLAHKLLQAKKWARIALVFAAAFLIAQGVAGLFALLAGGPAAGQMMSANPVLQFIDLGATFCAGLFATFALWQMYSVTAAEFFKGRGRESKKP